MRPFLQAARWAPLTTLTGLSALIPGLAMACACGCGVFDVGSGSLFQTNPGGVTYVEYNYMNQNQNWSGDGKAPAADNSDKQIESSFITLGGQYMFDRSWGVMAEIPFVSRFFRTENDAGTGVQSFNHNAFGDLRVMGVYSGFSSDMSTGLIFGAKLPTGDWKYPGFDRDTETGSGSTDVLVGGYHFGAITRDEQWTYFTRVMADLPVATQGGYVPGDEVDAAVGAAYNGLSLANGKIKIAPSLQLIGSLRGRDSGPEASPEGSGYSRLLVSPGVEIDAGHWKLYGDVELPVAQHINDNQLVAPALFKVIVSRSF
jgi:hypothetical protein